MPMQSFQGLGKESSDNRSKTLQNLFHSVKESGDHHLSGVVASARAVQKIVSQKRRPSNVALRPDNADPRSEVQWQTDVVNAVIQYVDIMSAVFASLLDASELLASGGICVMMEQRLGSKPLVDHIKAARHKVSSVAEESRETLRDMAKSLGACMEELTQAERAKSEYEHYTEKVSQLNDESAKNEIARMEEQRKKEEEQPDATRSRSGQLTEKISEKLANHRTQSLADRLARNQEKLQRWSLCVEESEKKAVDSWQACRRRVDELGSLAERIVCETVRALGSVASCGVSMRSSTTAPTSYGSPEHFTVNVCPVLVQLESESPDHASGHVEDTDAAPPVHGRLHAYAGSPNFRHIDEELQQKKETSPAGCDASECSTHDRPSSSSESEYIKEMDVRTGEAEQSLTVNFSPGPLGFRRRDGTVMAVFQGQGQKQGVKVGMRMTRIGGQKFSAELLHAKISGTEDYEVEFIDEVSPLSATAAPSKAVGQKAVSCCGQDPQLLILNEHALVRLKGESVDDSSPVTVFIGKEAMTRPEMNIQLKPSIAEVCIDRLNNIPAKLGQTNKNISRKLLKSIAILPDDLFSLNEAIFNTPVGSRIDSNATYLLFELMEQIHLVFRHGRYDKSDQNFLRDYVALLGTLQNQPFFDSQQGRAFHTWLFEALSSAGAGQHEHKGRIAFKI